MAREYVPLDLTAGVNHVEFAGIAAHLEPDSVILRDPAGRALQILEQNYRNDPISQELLLSFYEGKTIDFLVQRADRQEIVKGKIVRSGYVPSSYYAQNYQQPSLHPAHHRSRRRAALRFARSAAVSRALWRLDPQTDFKLAAPDQRSGQIRCGNFLCHRRHELAVRLQHRGLRQSQGQDRSARHGGLDHHAQSEWQNVRECTHQAAGRRCEQIAAGLGCRTDVRRGSESHDE